MSHVGWWRLAFSSASCSETDDFSYNIVDKPVHAHDPQGMATLFQLMGFDHDRLSYRLQGRDYRLTDLHGEVVHSILS